MHELAVAIAAGGHAVEIRGRVAADEVAELSAAAGAGPELPSEPRDIAADDVVLVPEGLSDPLLWSRLVLSPARVVVLMLAPPGLFGWPFVDGWVPAPAPDVLLDTLARPQHFQAMAALGLEIWTHMPHLAELARDAGVPCAFIGNGRPLPYPEPQAKRYDVAMITRRPWGPRAQTVVERLGPQISRVCIEGTNADVLRQLGQSRILIHPLHIEGNSRIGYEARSMGTVPIALQSNAFAVGLNDAGGAVTVPSLDDMPEAVAALLADPARLGELRERGMATARRQLDWPTYVSRVNDALNSGRADPGRAARATIGRALIADSEESRRRADDLDARRVALEDQVAHEQTLARTQLAAVSAQRDDIAAEYERTSAVLRGIMDTAAWRMVQRYWRTRDRLLRRRR